VADHEQVHDHDLELYYACSVSYAWNCMRNEPPPAVMLRRLVE
jgi:hypothetical protein